MSRRLTPSGCILWALAVLGTTLCGCRSFPSISSAGSCASAPQTSLSQPDPQSAPEMDLATALEKLNRPSEAKKGPIQALAISGGVIGAPFASGVLVGWTKSGTRPQFDIVAGVSSGSLLGAYAFLGSKYDSNLENHVKHLKASDLFIFQPVRSMIHEGALGSSKPAEDLIRSEVNEAFLEDMRQAHAEGRRFLVGTMNMETRRLSIWDLAALASSERDDAPELVRKVLLAGISWPGLCPPVEFDVEVEGHRYHEWHCDGGMAAMAFMVLDPNASWPEHPAMAKGEKPAGSNLYVLPGRKLYGDPAPAPKRVFSRVLISITSTLEALTRADIDRLYCLSLESGMAFHILSLPQGYRVEPLSFRQPLPQDASKIFDYGYKLAAPGPPWRADPSAH